MSNGFGGVRCDVFGILVFFIEQSVLVLAARLKLVMVWFVRRSILAVVFVSVFWER